MLRLYFPVSPLGINQKFGASPEYYARFKDSQGNPEKGHMGVDFMSDHGNKLYAPCDGLAWYAEDEHGGDGIYIRTQADDGQWYNVILWHLCSKSDKQYAPLIPTDGSRVPVKLGQHIGYTDNTGAPFESSGDHLHFGLVPTNSAGTQALYPSNGYNGCVDAMPYFTNYYAKDAETVKLILQKTVDLMKLFIASLQGKH